MNRKYSNSYIYHILSDLVALGLLRKLENGEYQYLSLSSQKSKPGKKKKIAKPSEKSEKEEIIEVKKDISRDSQDNFIEFEGLRAFLESDAIKDPQLKRIFLEIIDNHYPIGVHLINCHKRNAKINYKNLNGKVWDIKTRTKNGKEWKYKEATIPNVNDYGLTTIIVYEGKSNNYKPAITIIYKGDTGRIVNGQKEKLFLTDNTYPLWVKGVDDFLFLNMQATFKLSSFYLKTMDVNLDIDITSLPKNITDFKNVRIYDLNRIFEFYNLGNGNYRLGVRRSTSEDAVKVPEKNFFQAFTNLNVKDREKLFQLSDSYTGIKGDVENIKQDVTQINDNLKKNELTLKKIEDITKAQAEYKNLINKDLPELLKTHQQNSNEYLKRELIENTNSYLKEHSALENEINDFRREVEKDTQERNVQFNIQAQDNNQLKSQVQLIVNNLSELPKTLKELDIKRNKSNENIFGKLTKSNEDIFDKITKELSETIKSGDESVLEVILQIIQANKDNSEKIQKQFESTQKQIDGLVNIAQLRLKSEKKKHKDNSRKIKKWRKK